MRDADLLLEIKQALIEDERLSAQVIEVSVANGLVTLRGSVPSYRCKLAAHDIACFCSGSRAVVNELDVVPARCPSNLEIDNRVREEFARHGDMDAESINILSRGGIVTLQGCVASEQERMLAEDVALAVGGVRGVRNELIVDVMSQVEDAALSHDMLAALVPLPELERAHLRVAVSGDTVVLSGDVPGDREKEIVEDVVWQFRPLHVRNELLVKEAY